MQNLVKANSAEMKISQNDWSWQSLQPSLLNHSNSTNIKTHSLQLCWEKKKVSQNAQYELWSTIWFYFPSAKNRDLTLTMTMSDALCMDQNLKGMFPPYGKHCI